MTKETNKIIDLMKQDNILSIAITNDKGEFKETRWFVEVVNELEYHETMVYFSVDLTKAEALEIINFRMKQIKEGELASLEKLKEILIK